MFGELERGITGGGSETDIELDIRTQSVVWQIDVE